jgi:hypothetical protein
MNGFTSDGAQIISWKNPIPTVWLQSAILCEDGDTKASAVTVSLFRVLCVLTFLQQGNAVIREKRPELHHARQEPQKRAGTRACRLTGRREDIYRKKGIRRGFQRKT